jgi:hypothetical protein
MLSKTTPQGPHLSPAGGLGPASTPPPEPDGIARRVRAAIEAIQHRVATTLGVDESARTETVVAMLRNNRRRAPGYWIQLTLAMGIATVGLVLNSTAVVIGAMLVSPLMGPIVELGMGFAVGSPLLTLRASLRTFLSIVIVGPVPRCSPSHCRSTRSRRRLRRARLRPRWICSSQFSVH